MDKKKTLIVLGIIGIILIVSSSLFFFQSRGGDNEKTKDDSKINDNEKDNNVSSTEGGENMDDFVSKINVTVNGKTYTATLENNDTARALLKRLPLEVDMEELNGNEKYYYFDGSLPSNSMLVKKINRGDLMLYGNNCLVLFYETFNTSYSYTRIGKIDNPDSLESDVGEGKVKVSFTN